MCVCSAAAGVALAALHVPALALVLNLRVEAAAVRTSVRANGRSVPAADLAQPVERQRRKHQRSQSLAPAHLLQENSLALAQCPQRASTKCALFV